MLEIMYEAASHMAIEQNIGEPWYVKLFWVAAVIAVIPLVAWGRKRVVRRRDAGQWVAATATLFIPNSAGFRIELTYTHGAGYQLVTESDGETDTSGDIHCVAHDTCVGRFWLRRTPSNTLKITLELNSGLKDELEFRRAG